MNTKEEVFQAAKTMLRSDDLPKLFVEIIEKAVLFRDRIGVLPFEVKDIALALAICGAEESKPKPEPKKPAPQKPTDWSKVIKGTSVITASGSSGNFVKLIDKENGIAVVDIEDVEEKIPVNSLVIR